MNPTMSSQVVRWLLAVIRLPQGLTDSETNLLLQVDIFVLFFRMFHQVGLQNADNPRLM